MFKNIKILPLAVSFIVFCLMECFLMFPDFFYVALIFINLIIFHISFQTIKQSNTKEKWYNFFILPSFFTTSAACYSIMLTNNWTIQFIFVLTSVFIYLYFRQVYYYIVIPERYKENALENFSSYGNFLVMFFSFSVLYGLQSFLNIPIHILILVLVPVIWLVSYQVIWTNKIDMREGIVFVLINTLILTELAWAASFLPQSYNTIGLIVAICYYMATGIVRFSLNQKLQNIRHKTRQYLVFGIACILIILLTSKWI